jgi:hypothetical protein
VGFLANKRIGILHWVRSYHLRRHVEVVGDPDAALSLCLLEGGHGERVARAWKPLYDDLGPSIH